MSEKSDNTTSKFEDFSSQGGPTKEEQESFVTMIKRFLNKDGSNPKADEYVDTTYNYIVENMKKMENSNDKDATSKAIFEDICNKVGSWVNESSEKNAETPATAEKKSTDTKE